jgi:hypothetical protein
LNGQTGTASVDSISGTPNDFNIGSDFASSYLNGALDEVRISNIARSADWIKTEYNNQKSPSTFYAYGALGINGRQSSSAAPVPAVKVRGGVRFH